MKALCVIPARGGSKRIPRKNIRDFAGKPMIAWSIEAAKASGVFDEVVVSTDDAEIADIARQCGATVPFMRPPELADDHTGTVEVVQHAVRCLTSGERRAENVCCLYATAPFVTAASLAEGLNALLEGSWEYCFPVCTYDFPVLRALRVFNNGAVEPKWPEFSLTRSQDLQELVHDAGQFYWGRSAAWIAGRPIYGPKSKGLHVPRDRVQGIDTEEDWRRADFIHRALATES